MGEEGRPHVIMEEDENGIQEKHAGGGAGMS